MHDGSLDGAHAARSRSPDGIDSRRGSRRKTAASRSAIRCRLFTPERHARRRWAVMPKPRSLRGRRHRSDSASTRSIPATAFVIARRSPSELLGTTGAGPDPAASSPIWIEAPAIADAAAEAARARIHRSRTGPRSIGRSTPRCGSRRSPSRSPSASSSWWRRSTSSRRSMLLVMEKTRDIAILRRWARRRARSGGSSCSRG